MNTKFKRVIAMILVISLMLTMPGCAYVEGEPVSLVEGIVYMVTGIVQAVVLGVGELILSGIFLGLDKLISPVEEWLGWGDWWDVQRAGVPVLAWYGKLVDPNNRFSDWDQLLEEYKAMSDDEEQLGGLPQTGGEEPGIRIPHTGPEEPVEKQRSLGGKIKQLLKKLFGCDHVLTYNSEILEIECGCGSRHLSYYPEMTYDEFKIYVTEESGQSQLEYNRFALREYCRYVADHSDVDPDMLHYALQLDIPSLDEQKKEQFVGIVNFLSNTVGTISTGVDHLDLTAKSLGFPMEWLGNINTYFSGVQRVFATVNAGMQMAKYEELLQQPGKERESVHAAINSLRSATSMIPWAGLAFNRALNTVEVGLETVLKGNDIKKLEQFLWDNLDEDSPLSDVPRYWNIHNRDLWTYSGDNSELKCPSLKELAAADLTLEQIYILTPYIEARLQFEMEQIFGDDLSTILCN